MFAKPQFPTERNMFRLANGVNKTISVVVRNTYEGKTDQLPEDWHRKLVIALAHDEVSIENERLLSNVTMDGDYGIDWQEFLNYPLAQATFQVQVTPFDATNSNCQTCDEMTQLSLVDDTTDEVWDEGTTHEFPDVLTDNDSICCRPYTIMLVRYNTAYFDSVTISAAGVLTATVIDPAPVLDDVWIATYRVTCPDGSYDEADVYGNITGTDTSFCYPVEGEFMFYIPTGNSTTAEIVLDAIPGPPNTPLGILYELYETADLGTIIQSGEFPGGFGNLLLTGLTAGVSYTICAVSDCGGYDYSVPKCIEFTITSFAAATCGNFIVTYLPYADPAPQSISYMNCAGEVTNRVFAVAESAEICMLITADSETPVYFVASSADITLNYDSLCE